MLLFNLDCTDFFMHHDTRTDGGSQVDRYLDRILDGGVTQVLCNTQAERVNYASTAWEPFWTGYDPDGPDDQDFLAPLSEAGSKAVARWRQLVDSMYCLAQQGVDYPARFIERTHHRGAAAWISLRMNDVHCQANEGHPIHSNFWREHLHLRRRGYDGYFAKALDYAHVEVRDHYRALILETLERFDVDGLELDFLREPYLFSRGEEAAGSKILTAWLREVRRLVNAQADRRGRAIQLGVRVPSRPDTAFRFGLDPVTWAREGLIDLLVPTPRWASTEFDLPIPEWRRRLAGSATILAGGLEANFRPFHSAGAHGVTPAQARGAAAQVLADGADGVYLFNYFPSGQAAGGNWWNAEEYPKILLSMTNLQDLLKSPRGHAISGHDISNPDGSEDPTDQLPAKGPLVELRLPIASAPNAGTAVLQLDIEARANGPTPPPVVRVNGGVPLRLSASQRVGSEQRQFPVAAGFLHGCYDLPLSDLDDVNHIQIASTDGEPITVLSLSIDLHPAVSISAE